VLQGSLDGLTDPRTVVTELFRRQHEVAVTDGGTAGTGVAESPVATVQGAQQVTQVLFTAPIGVTAAASNNLTVTISKRTAGGAATVVATGVTTAGGLGTLVALAPVVIPLSTVAGAVILADGDTLTATLVKNASGVAFAAATSFGRVEIECEAI
jgi:hypothetical protein